MTPDCEKVLTHLGETLSGELLAHAQSCAECQLVQQSYRLLRGRGGVTAHGAWNLTLPAAAAVELRKHPRARPWWWGMVALALLYLALVFVGLVLLGTPETEGEPPLPLGLRAIGVGLASLSIIGFAAGLAPRARRLRLALFPLLGLLLVGIVAFAPSPGPGPFLAKGMPCLAVEVLMSLLPIGLGVWLLTRSAFHPIRSLLIPFCCATAGLVVLCFHCSNGLSSHLVVFHLAPWMALGVLAWAVRAKTRSHSYAP